MNNTLENKCPGCGATIKFNPVNQKWDCEYCGSKFSLDDMQKYNNASSLSVNVDTSNNVSNSDNSMDVYHCSSCGAEVITDALTTSTFCVYCGNMTIIKNRLMGEFHPSKIIPFKKTKEDAIAAFKKMSKGKPLMPRLFNDVGNIEKVTGVYIPFWTYDFNFNGDVTFKCTDTRSWSDFNYRYTETRIYSVRKNAMMNFKNVPVDGSSRFRDELMDSIEPFEFNELVDYNHAYLSGFLAEKYDISSEESSDRAVTRADNTAIDTVKKSIRNHESKFLTNNNMSKTMLASNYILLPVWMVNIMYKDKMYTFAMNGQTGKLVGDIPLDKKRVVLFSILTFVISFILILVGVLIVRSR